MGKQSAAESVDTLIVGGGISGLYAAWRIAREKPDASLCLLEMMPRTGGRLESDFVDLPGLDGKPHRVKDEMGGMRFNPSMVELYRLFKEMDFSFDNGRIVPFEMADPGNRYYLRGESFTVADVAAEGNQTWAELYNLPVTEQGKSPGTLIREVMNSILRLPENAERLHRELAAAERAEGKAVTLADWPLEPEQWTVFRNEFTYRGHTINQWGLWPLLMDYGMSNEAIELITNAIGFTGPVDQNINAGEQLQILCDFPNDPKFFTLNGGFESLPLKVEALLEEALPGCVRTNHRVVRLTDGPDGYPRVTVSPNKGDEYQIDCRRLVLALPKYPLDKLLANSHEFTLADHVSDDLAGLQNMRLAKVNFYYSSRWWRDGGNGPRHGGTFTDLPAGSAYVFDPLYPGIDSPEYLQASQDEKTAILDDYSRDYTGPSALTLYCDFINTNFWVQLQAIGEPYSTGFPQLEHSTAASTALVAEATRQFKLMYARNDVPDPVLTTFRVWSDNDYGYGYHQWKIGRNDAEIRNRLWQLNEHTFLCNEAISDMQGWVNGSLRSTETVLKRAFGIEPLVTEKQRAELRQEMLAAHGTGT